MVTYIHEREDWPEFRYDADSLAELLTSIRERQASLSRRMMDLGFPLRRSAMLGALTQEVQKSSSLDGEPMETAQVRSSVVRRLGIVATVKAETRRNRNVDGVVEMVLDAIQQHAAPLTEERLHRWHSGVFPTGFSDLDAIKVGEWRDDTNGPMEVISRRRIGGPKTVHFEAPAAPKIGDEMANFLRWFEASDAVDPIVKAALAHLWFVTIHPFDDGNGRIARAIADLALARAEQSTMRFYSMSVQIEREKKAYYDVLEQTQKGCLDVTDWLVWFLTCLDRAIEDAEQGLTAIQDKERFWKSLNGITLNVRQTKIVNFILDGRMQCKLTKQNWKRCAKCSCETAIRDLEALVRSGVLEEEGEGRGTSYLIRLPHQD